MKKYNLAILETHPVTYRIGIYETLGLSPQINLTVLFCTDSELWGNRLAPESKVINPIKSLNFHHKFLKNYFSLLRKTPPKGLLNLGIIPHLIKNRPDALIIYGYKSHTARIAFITAKLLGIPIIFRDELDFIDYSTPIAKKLKRLILPKIFEIPSAFLCSYTRSKEYYLSLRVPREKLFLHPCAVDNKIFQSQAKRGRGEIKAIKESLKIPENSKIILQVGRIEDRKRVLDTAKAYSLLEDKDETFLFFVGDGNTEDKLKKFAKKNKLKNLKIINSINRDQLYKFYSIADLFTIPSDYDPSPKSMNEAMNFSLPIITTKNVGTAQDLVKNGKNGFKINVGDIKDFAQKIQEILSNKGLAKKMGEESLRVVSKWSFEADMKATIKALNYIHKNKNGKNKN
jgi:glycosyltransferase involved in cell wall biosynthesis